MRLVFSPFDGSVVSGVFFSWQSIRGQPSVVLNEGANLRLELPEDAQHGGNVHPASSLSFSQDNVNIFDDDGDSVYDDDDDDWFIPIGNSSLIPPKVEAKNHTLLASAHLDKIAKLPSILHNSGVGHTIQVIGR
jgi:hypothetical protein